MDRVRCAEHGLAYDPALATGCVLCRRSLPAPPRRSRWMLWVGVIILGLAASAACLAARREATSPSPAPSRTPGNPEATLSEVRGQVTRQNSAGRSGSFFLPAQRAQERAPVLVAIHGTGASGQAILAHFEALARSRGFAIVAPDSRVSPHGQWTWQVGERPGEITEDLPHIVGCLDEVAQQYPERLDLGTVLIAGHSGGGSSAPYVATQVEPFTEFAVLHGGIFPASLGSRQVRAWFSTGTDDHMRTPAMVRDAAARASAAGLLDVTYREFTGGHAVLDAERSALVDWWLGPAVP